MKLLWLDDDYYILQVLEDYLTTINGIEFVLCSTINEATDALESSQFDVIVLDLYIEGKIYPEFLTWVRNKFNDTKVLLTTVSNKGKELTHEFKLDDCLSKPFPLERIDEILNQKSV